MSAHKTKPISYQIPTFVEIPGRFALLTVTGIAIDYPLDVRICARKVKDIWQLDDYDTGCSLATSGLRHKSMKSLLDLGMAILPTYINDGSYSRQQAKAMATILAAMAPKGGAA